MEAIRATWKNGQIVFDRQVHWPEGCRLVIEPEDTLDQDGPMTPDEIARTLAAMEKVQPFEMTEEERADIEAWRQKVKEYTIANMHKGIEELFP